MIATHPIQYQVPLWRALAQIPGVQLRVLYASDCSVRGYHDVEFNTQVQWDVPLVEGYPHKFLGNSDKNFTAVNVDRARQLHLHLREFKPDICLLNAYLPIFWLEALAIVRSLRLPVLLRAETSDIALRRSLVKNAIRNCCLRLFYSQCSQLLAIGKNSLEHYTAHGVPPQKISMSPYCVDTNFISEQYHKYVPQRKILRQELGFCDAHIVFIYSGKFIPKKNPLLITESLRNMPESVRNKVCLIAMGDGELKDVFENQCRALLGDRCVMLGFVNQRFIGRYYAAADGLLLPSSWGETWGLVVNEALQFGVPVIVSDRVGCCNDLVERGKTGFAFPTDDAKALLSAMLEFVEWKDSRQQDEIAELCKRRVANYTIESAARGIYLAMGKVLGDSVTARIPKKWQA